MTGASEPPGAGVISGRTREGYESGSGTPVGVAAGVCGTAVGGATGMNVAPGDPVGNGVIDSKGAGVIDPDGSGVIDSLGSGVADASGAGVADALAEGVGV